MKNPEKAPAYKVRILKISHFVDFIIMDAADEGEAHNKAIKSFERLKPEMREAPKGTIVAITMNPDVEAMVKGGGSDH